MNAPGQNRTPDTTIRAPRVAVLLPCHNEGPVVADVVRQFRTALPHADIYVYDNASTDDTAEQARSAEAIVRYEDRLGKGNVVRRMFSDVEADIYVMADGDGTYDAQDAPAMIARLSAHNLDMVVGVRVPVQPERSYRRGHVFGNRLLTGTVRLLFENRFTDILSGYRVMSQRFVRSFPALATGFEIETMLTIHALELRLPTAEMDCRYRERGSGTASKLNTYRDGLRILRTIFSLFKETRPFAFFGLLSILFAACSVALGIPIIVEFIATGLVPRVPTAILSTGLMIFAGIFLTSGLILDSVSRSRLEAKRLGYQALASTATLLATESAER